MTSMPSITPTEIALFCAAALLLCIAPVVLAWSDARRRRRELGQAALSTFGPAAPPLPMAAAYESLPQAEPVAPAPMEAPASVLAELLDEPVVAPAAEFPEAALEASAQAPEPVAAEPAAPAAVRHGAPAAPPPEEAPRYQFQLLDLRQARLPDWPPPAIRDDVEGYRIWREAERVAALHDRAISTVPLVAPEVMQSTALGAAESDGSKFRLHFLLFPTLWPVGADQAVAEAVFEIDPSAGVLRSWVARLRRS